MTATAAITEEAIINKIYLVRGYKVMLDKDLAELYGVETKVLNQAVKRNPLRFPEDFMFQVTNQELTNLRSQIVTSSWGGQRYLPYAFTEHGVLMLSSVLNSQRAIQMNIHIMRVYTKLREVVLTNKDLLLKLEQLESRVSGHDEDMQMIFTALKQLLNPSQPPRKRIGFRSDEILDILR